MSESLRALQRISAQRPFHAAASGETMPPRGPIHVGEGNGGMLVHVLPQRGSIDWFAIALSIIVFSEWSDGSVIPVVLGSGLLGLMYEMAFRLYLTQYGLMAKRQWREFRPAMVREMEMKGTLMEALFDAQETTINEMEALTRQLETEQKMTPQQAHERAWEIIREKYILLPPEES